MKQLHKIEGILVKERKCLLPWMNSYMPTAVFNIDSRKPNHVKGRKEIIPKPVYKSIGKGDSEFSTHFKF